MAEQLITSANIEIALVDRASAQIQNLSKSFDSFGKSVSGLEKTAIAVGAAIGAVGFAAIKFGKAAFNESARVRELDVAMQAIGNSTKIGYSTINMASKSIRKMGIELAASQQIAIEFAQNNLDMAKAAKIARVAQDLAVIGQKNSTETTLLLTRAIITGRTELLKSAGVQKSAGQMYEEYAATLGKASTSLSAVEKQTAVLNGVLEEGTRVAGTYEAAMQEPGKVLRSFPRLINDIQVAMGMALTDGFGPMIMAAYDLTKIFAKAVGEGGKLEGIVVLLRHGVEMFTTPLTNLILNMQELLKSFSFNATEAIKFIKPMKELAPIILAISTGLSTLAGSSLLAALGFKSLATKLNPWIAGFTVLIAMTPRLQESIAKLFNALKPLLPIIVGVGKAIVEGFASALDILLPAIEKLVDFIVILLKPLQNLKTDSDNAGKATKILADFVAGLTLVFVSYKTAMLLAAGASQIFAAGQAIAAFASLGFAGALQAVKVALISTGIGAIVVLIGTLAAAFYTAWQNSQTFRDKVTGAFNKIRPVLQAFVDLFLGQINLFIKAWNALPFTDKIKELTYEVGVWKAATISDTKEAADAWLYYSDANKVAARQRAKDMQAERALTKSTMDENKEAMEGARQKAKELADRIKGLHLAAKEAVQGFKDFNFEVRDTRSLTQKVSEAFVKMDMDMYNANMSADDLLNSFQEFTKTLQNNFSVALENARQKLDDARQKFDEFKNVISGSIKGVIRFEKAVEEGDFLAGLIKQAEDATKFSDQVKKLIEMGLSESAITKVVDAGYEAGTIIADQIIAGGQTVVNQVNKLVADVEKVADAVGYFGAQRFYQAGIDQANALVDGILSQMNQRESEIEAMIARLTNLLDTKARAEAALATTTSTLGGGASTSVVADAAKKQPTVITKLTAAQLAQQEAERKAFQKIVDENARARAARGPLTSGGPSGGTTIKAVKQYVSPIGPRPIPFAEGGIVNRPTLALIGEKGPEAVIPLNKAGGMGGGAVYNITVNAGIGTNGQEVGKQIVEAIKKFERSSGPVFAKA